MMICLILLGCELLSVVGGENADIGSRITCGLYINVSIHDCESAPPYTFCQLYIC